MRKRLLTFAALVVLAPFMHSYSQDVQANLDSALSSY
jgi:hypothetical protein